MATVSASLDHFIGRQATDVLSRSDAWDWSIQLEGGILVSNKDKRRTAIPEVKGKVLNFVALSETDTRMQFGHVTLNEAGDPVVAEETWVELSPTLYTIGGMEGQTEEYYPQAAPELADALPPDPSDERVVDGPEKPVEGDGG